NYALCLMDLKRFDEAVTELRQLAAVRNRILGPLHCDSLYSTWRLAEALRQAGKSSESLAVLEELYSILRQSPELPNWRRAEMIRNIASVYIALGRVDRAAELYAIVDKLLSAATIDDSDETEHARCINLLAETFVNGNVKALNVNRGIELATKACELTQ